MTRGEMKRAITDQIENDLKSCYEQYYSGIDYKDIEAKTARLPIADVIRYEVAREIIGEVFSYVHGNERLTENIPEIELFKFGMFIGELEKKYDPKSKKIITDNTHQE